MTSKPAGKVAFVLASGGITGMAYEVGALRALDHAMVDRTTNSFDVYVGTSAGALVAALAAAGVKASILAQALAGTVEGYPQLQRWRLYRPNVGELGSRARRVLGGAAVAAWNSRGTPGGKPHQPSLGSLVPSGLFTTSGIEAYVRETLRVVGVADRLDAIDSDLQIVAADLETGARVAFSPATHASLHISRAVAASAAIPMLFRPVEINGHRYIDGSVTGTAAIDVAVASGATMIVVINGLVPIDTALLSSHAAGNLWPSVYDRGVRGIQNQVRREAHHERLLLHLRELGRSHPQVDFLLVEPRPDDEKMPFHNLMSFRARLIVLQHGYESVVSGLLADWDRVSTTFDRHGIEVSDVVLRRGEAQVPIVEMPDRKSTIGKLRRTVLDRRLRQRGSVPTPAPIPIDIVRAG